MSRLITSLRFLIAGFVLWLGSANYAAAQGYYDDAYRGSSYQQFYDELSPYGEWISDPEYGYVWVPDAGDDFRPYYSNGYWVNSDYGNTWVSNYSWGWAPFHYGRWTYNNYYGWIWIPGNVWGPAWVSWRSGGGAYGWAPLGPGVSINIAIGGYSCPDYWWTFAPQQYILSPRFQQHCYGPRYAPRYVQQTTIINNTYVYNNNTYIAGPRRREMERAIGRPVQQVAINNASRPMRSEMRGNSLSLFRPAIAESRPQATERPRNFSQARQPIASESRSFGNRSNAGEGFERGSVQQRRPDFGDRGNVIQQPAQQQQPSRNAWSNRTPEMPRQERPGPDPVMQAPAQQQQPDRRFDRQPQVSAPVDRPRNWGGTMNRMSDREQMQQAEPQRAERPVFNRGAEMQRPQEAQRPNFPQRMERPQPAPVQERPQPAQRMEQRMEAPRPTPAPQQGRPQMGSGIFRR